MRQKGFLQNGCSRILNTSPANWVNIAKAAWLTYVRLEFNPTGVSPDTNAVAKALGNCLVEAPDLQATLVSILETRDQQRISERLDTAEALIIEAVLALSRGGAELLYAKEIAIEVNRLLEARGERSKLNPEKVGHRLRKLGLSTCRLSQAGNGLVMGQRDGNSTSDTVCYVRWGGLPR